MFGTENRILDVSPAAFEGTKLYGGKNDLSITTSLAKEILQYIFERDTRFIPQYKETFKTVLERYHNDSHGYGLNSYQYKKVCRKLWEVELNLIDFRDKIYSGNDINYFLIGRTAIGTIRYGGFILWNDVNLRTDFENLISRFDLYNHENYIIEYSFKRIESRSTFMRIRDARMTAIIRQQLKKV